MPWEPTRQTAYDDFALDTRKKVEKRGVKGEPEGMSDRDGEENYAGQ